MVIKDGRHPVVEKVMNIDRYVPNDCVMNNDREILLITGPNMSGKSTYMRQIALTSYLSTNWLFCSCKRSRFTYF